MRKKHVNVKLPLVNFTSKPLPVKARKRGYTSLVVHILLGGGTENVSS